MCRHDRAEDPARTTDTQRAGAPFAGAGSQDRGTRAAAGSLRSRSRSGRRQALRRAAAAGRQRQPGRVSLRRGDPDRPRLEPGRSGPRQRRGERGRRVASPRWPRPDRGQEPSLPGAFERCRGGRGRAGVFRDLRDLGGGGARGGGRWPVARRLERVPAARLPPGRHPARGRGAGQLRARPRAQRHRFRRVSRLSGECRARGAAHLRRRPPRWRGAVDDAGPRGGDADRASIAAPAPRTRLPAARPRPAHGIPRDQLRRLRDAARAPGGAALDRPPSFAEGRSHRRELRATPADRLLRRPRHARAGPQRAPRGRLLVGAGFHRRWVRSGLQRRAAAGGSPPLGCALQRDPVGASGDPRLVLRRRHRRSAHRGADQGTRHARVAARSPGSTAVRRAPGYRRHRPRWTRTILSSWRSRGSASWLPTRSAMPSVSATTSRRHRSGAPR